MTALKGVRERARAEITAAITAEAKRQLAEAGAVGLSLRAVARELGVASSALYRYFPSRDDLLTALIVDAYDSLGAAAEAGALASRDAAPPARLLAVAQAIRDWALARPHEYALLYGSPVPGYRAPEATIGPASRVTLALIGVVDDAYRAGLVSLSDDAALSPALRRDCERVVSEAGLAVPAWYVGRLVVAWTQLFGLVSFELFGHTHGVFEAHGDLFAHAVALQARFLGLG